MGVIQLNIRHHGFTLIELMITTLIFGILITGLYSLMKIQQASYQAQGRDLTMHQILRGSMLLMERDIRMAGYDPQNTGQFGD